MVNRQWSMVNDIKPESSAVKYGVVHSAVRIHLCAERCIMSLEGGFPS